MSNVITDSTGKVLVSNNSAFIAAETPTQSKTLTLGSAAPSTVTPDSGYALSSVPVSLDTSVIKAGNIVNGVLMLGITGTYVPSTQTKSVIYTANGHYTFCNDSGYDGIRLVDVYVEIPSYDGSVS